MTSFQHAARRKSGNAAAHLLSGAVFLLGFLVYFAPLGAASALPCCAVLAVWMAASDGYLDLRRSLLRLSIFAPLLAYMALSAAWAIDATAALWLALRLSVLAVAAVLLIQIMQASPFERRLRLTRCFSIGLAVSSGIVAADLLTGARLAIAFHSIHDPSYGPNAYSRGSVFAAISAGAVSLGLWRSHRIFVAVLTLVAVAAAVFLGSQLSAKLALLLSAAATMTVLARPGFRWLLPQLLILAALTVPFWLPAQLPPVALCWLGSHKPSALHRIFIWNFVANHIHERPIFGWGLDAARRLPGGGSLVPIANCLQPGAPPLMGQLLPLHPHNGVLQVWLELGATGAVLGFGALSLCIARALRPNPQGETVTLAMITGTVAAIIAVGGFSFGVWQEWWIATAVFACAVTVTACSLSAEPQAQGLSSRSTSV